MRIKALDILRGLAAVSVFLFHFDIINYGYLGVHLFFLISGFVIFLTASKLDTPVQFIISRFTRLYPTYWVCMFISILFLLLNGNVPIYGGAEPVTIRNVAVNLTMFQYFFRVGHIDPAYWTLTEELFFYFIIFCLLCVKKIQQYQWWCAGMLFISLLGLTVIHSKSITYHTQFFPLFAGGVYFYHIYLAPDKTRYNLPGVVVCFILSLCYSYRMPAVGKDYHMEMIGISLCYLVFALFSFQKLNFIASWRPLLFMGAVSYPFYLLHQNIGRICEKWLTASFGLPAAIQVILIFAFILLLAFVVYLRVDNVLSKKLKNFLSDHLTSYSSLRSAPAQK